MRFFVLFLFSLSLTAAHSQNQRCFMYDAAGNRTTRVAGTCDAPSGLIANDNGLPGEATAHAAEALSPAREPVLSEGVVDLGAPLSGVVYPNPTTGKFAVSLDGLPLQEVLLLELYDARGQRIARTTAETGGTASFDLSGRAPGHYFLVARQGGRTAGTWQVVKE